MTLPEEMRRTLAHDVGKYVARTARNLPPVGTPVPAVLLPMLLRDLYEGPASARFEDVLGGADAPFVAPCRSEFAQIDALEADVRAGDEAAVRRAAALALGIAKRLRALV